MLERISWGIDEGTKARVIMADGSASTPLGLIQDISIQVGKACLNIPQAVVTPATSYDLILGTDWMHRVGANVDIRRQLLVFTNHGQKHKVPIESRGSSRKASQASETEWQGHGDILTTIEDEDESEANFLQELRSDFDAPRDQDSGPEEPFVGVIDIEGLQSRIDGSNNERAALEFAGPSTQPPSPLVENRII